MIPILLSELQILNLLLPFIIFSFYFMSIMFNYYLSSPQNPCQIDDRKKTAVDWSTLPDEILRLCADKVASARDFIVFGAVCKSWRSAAPNRFPWLLARRYDKILDGNDSDIISSNEFLISLFRGEQWWRYWGSCTGWIIGQNQNDYSLKLMNPMTQSVVPLPKPPYPVKKGLVFETSSAQSGKSNINVMAICYTYGGVTLLKHGCSEWSYFEFEESPKSADFVDMVWYNDFAFAVLSNGNTVVFADDGVVEKIDSPRRKVEKGTIFYLVESAGTLLLVMQQYVNSVERYNFEVYGLNLDSKNWKRVQSLGNRSLFIGEGYSMSVIMDDDTGDSWKRNCIYTAAYNRISDGVLNYFDMNKKRMESLRLGHVKGINRCYDFIWFMPASNSSKELSFPMEAQEHNKFSDKKRKKKLVSNLSIS